MKMKLMVLLFTFLITLGGKSLWADENCERTSDWFIPNTHECVYCPADLAWGTSGPTCGTEGSCDHGTNVNHSSHTNFCLYCSHNFCFDPESHTCVPGTIVDGNCSPTKPAPKNKKAL